jgi:hypothetical protein
MSPSPADSPPAPVRATDLAATRDKQRRTSEFIQEKREIFLLQLLIDGKRCQIRRIVDSIAEEEQEFAETESLVEQASEDYKLRNAQVEADLAKARMKMETATRKRVECQKQVKHMVNCVAVVKSEIVKSEALLESRLQMKQFLRAVAPDGANPRSYFTDPQQLVDEFTRLEQENLIIYRHIQHYNERLDRAQATLTTEIATNDGGLADIRARLDTVGEVDEITLVAPAADAQEAELATLSRLIDSTYMSCFPKDESDASPLVQLGKIEANLEVLHRQLEKIEPGFIREKQIVRDKERREHQRRARQAKQAEDQKLKIAQAMERANKPIKRKEGRPLVRRATPVKTRKNNDIQFMAMRREQMRIEKVLYGPLFD